MTGRSTYRVPGAAALCLDTTQYYSALMPGYTLALRNYELTETISYLDLLVS